MALYIIPIDTNLVSQKKSVSLDGVSFFLRFDWNDRAQHWFLSIYDSDDVLLLRGRKLAVNWNALNDLTFSGMPKGRIVTWDTMQSSELITRDDYGGETARVRFYYVSES